MSEQANEGNDVTGNDGGGATSDENYRGDAGDQANDLRFSEEQQLINSQAKGKFPDSDTENLEPVPGGGYTGAQKEGVTDSGYTGEQDPDKEGEYTDVAEDPADGTGPQGEYTDADSVPSIQEGGDAKNDGGSH